jgi:hypothetical protein
MTTSPPRQSAEQFARPNGKVSCRNSFVTGLPVSRKTGVGLIACGSARWKIEDETFNVLNNNGDNLVQTIIAGLAPPKTA